jgi:anti-sigma regulatory factor (Ser/Thr protein kinase)
MDWYLDSGDTAGVPTLRRQIMAYLQHHAVDGSDLTGTEVVVAELLSNAVAHTAGPAWVTLEWDADHPRLRVADLGRGFDGSAVGAAVNGSAVNGGDGERALLTPTLPADPLSDRGRGLYLVSRLAREVAVSRRGQGGCVVAATLDVQRG